ncbi:MAG: hypothetical protein Q9198_001529 [Flavoplaca austrocitrina]
MTSEGAAAEAGNSLQETQFTAIPDDAETSPAEALNHQFIPDRSNHAHQNDARKSTYGTANGSAEASLPNTDRGKNVPKPAASPRALSPDLLRGLLMVLQAIDHCSVSQGAWRHGVALESEQDGAIVMNWNHPVPWTARMLTHLCAPGFMFLLGMGIVYFGRSRSKLGWSS